MRSIIFFQLLFVILFSSCRTCDIWYDLGNKKKGFIDIEDFSNKKPYGLRFGVDTGDDVYKYSNDSLNPRLHYQFLIATPSLPKIKLNSFEITRQVNKDTIECKLYFKSNNLKNYIPIKELPFNTTKELEDRQDIFTIIAECSESYHQIKNIYVSYDIEVGDERIIMKNIQYKRRWFVDCRPK